jgi:hypothetical protein
LVESPATSTRWSRTNVEADGPPTSGLSILTSSSRPQIFPALQHDGHVSIQAHVVVELPQTELVAKARCVTGHSL